MPISNVGSVDHYPFGAPASAATVLKFRVKQGGSIAVRLSAEESETDLTMSVQVSADNSTYNATTAALNGTAVTDTSVPARTFKDVAVKLRAGVDLYMRVLASGSGKGACQIRHDGILEPMPV